MTDISRYFDWAATSPQDKELCTQALNEALDTWGNPSSNHQAGKEAREIFENARSSCAKTLGVKPESIYFTSGGTESDQLVLLSVLSKPVKGTILISSIEHPAIREQALILKKCGWNIQTLKTNKLGIITPETVSEAITDDTHLICIMAVNNETGIIQPIYEIADAITKKTAGKRRPKFHVDCVQAAGKIPLNINYPGIDSAAFSAHKICGPRGIGILYLKDSVESFLRGGGQEKGIRSGTENVFGAIAFSKVLEKYYLSDSETSNEADSHFSEMKKITDSFVDKLSNLKGCTIIPEGRKDNDNSHYFSPYVLQAAFKNIPGQVMLRALDAKGFCISTGSACSAKKASRPVLEAMQIPQDQRETAVRFSFGPLTKEKDVEELFKAVSEINNTFNK